MSFTERYLRTPGVVEIAGRQIKRYHVNVADAEIEPEIQDAAYAFVEKLLPDRDETPPAGFVVLHRGADASFLLVYTWVWDNVVDCRCAVAGIPFLGAPDEDPTNFVELTRPWIGCVYELPALTHERSAWVRHMLVPQRADLEAYLMDTRAEGMVGGA